VLVSGPTGLHSSAVSRYTLLVVILKHPSFFIWCGNFS
jgi:hypothetical protein